jgi:dinuclear metal center YbgI/SA1388 family protein
MMLHKNGEAKMGADRQGLAQYLETFLNVAQFRDYCPNGCQVEGRMRIDRIVTGVTASLDLLKAAHARQADAILVHHGYFWRNEAPSVVGMKKHRLQLLLQHDINLFAYHLPLDAHAEVGNNAMLAHRLGLRAERYFGHDSLGCLGRSIDPHLSTVGELAASVCLALGREPLLVGDPQQKLGVIAWCTGAAQSMFEEAVAAGASVFISGEISEPTAHIARENGVAYLAAGHHATERYGIQALGEHLARHFGLDHQFIDIDNPA